MKRMLFNATQQEELRVAIVDGQKLIDIDIEATGREQRKSNIYKGVITRIEPSLEACFVNYGEERHGFLPFKEVARGYFREGVDVRNASIKDALREGQEIVVQVEKEERGNKGAALTSFISLAGRYLVLMPNNPRGGGVSRRVEGEDRQELRETMDKLDLPSGMSVIARTAGIGRNVDELQWDLNYLMQLWRAIEGAGKSAPGAFLIYQESSLVIRAIRDYFQPDIGEILIDTDFIYEQAQQFMSHVMPDMVHRVKRYRDDVPLFSRFQIEHQIETAYSRTVPLPSGGAIVIDHTEALVSVDVNSARATRGSDIETTAFHTNCEAAEEVARQLRLRDLGGLIVIDFIDMENSKNQREVETRLKDALHYDRARVQMGKISRFGLMELSRQRLRPSLSEGSHVTCPRCNGTGHIRDTESSALQVLRIIQEEAMKENSAAIHVQTPVDVAAFLLNEKRGEILKIETRHRVTVILIPNKHLETPHYKLDRIKHDDPRLEDAHASYTMAEEVDTDIAYGKSSKEESRPRQEAMVKGITPDQPAPIVDRKPVEAPVAVTPAAVTAPAEKGFFARMFGWLFKGPEAPAPVAAPAVETSATPSRERNDRGGRNQRNRHRGNRGGRDRNEERDDTKLEDNKREGKQRDDKRDDKRTGKTDDANKAAAPVAEQSNPNQRQPREPRPPREAREPRADKNGENKTEAKEKQQRPPRPPREERKEAEAKAEDQKPVDLLAAEAVGTDETIAPGTAEATEAGGEERRRRRRRGGRNRNRREREANGELSTAGEGGEDEDEGGSEQADDAVQAPAAPSFTAHESAPESAPAVEAPAYQEAVVASPVVASPVVHEPAPVALPVQGALPLEPVHTTTAIEPAAVAAQAPAAEIVAPAAIAPVEPSTPAAPAAPVVTTAAPAPTPRVVYKSHSKVEVTPMPIAHLQEVLAAAGLTLAMTDPQKHKEAQEAAARIVPAPRIPRERKPLPPISNEPLIQVETRPGA